LQQPKPPNFCNYVIAPPQHFIKIEVQLSMAELLEGGLEGSESKLRITGETTVLTIVVPVLFTEDSQKKLDAIQRKINDVRELFTLYGSP